jgi:hypothetical protein
MLDREEKLVKLTDQGIFTHHILQCLEEVIIVVFLCKVERIYIELKRL